MTNYIENNITEKRKSHIYGVAETAIKLAKLYNIDPKKAQICALFHDLYKQKSIDEMNELIKEWHLDTKYIAMH